MKKGFKALTLLIVILMVLTGCSSNGGINESKEDADFPKSIILASGPIGGPWYSVCTKISEILMREIPGITVSVTEGGAEANLDLLDKGNDAQLAMTSSVAIQQMTDGTVKSLENISGVLPIVTSYIQPAVLEESSITGMKDVIGKKVSAGKTGFASEVIFKEILKAYGITYKDIEDGGGNISLLNWAEYPDMIADNHLDVICLNGEVPHNIYMQIEVNKPLRLLSVDEEEKNKVLENMPSLFTTKFPAGVYEGTKEEVELFAYSGLLAANDDLSDEFLLKIMNIIQDNKDEIVNELNFVDLLGWENSKSGLDESLCRPAVWNLIEEKTK